MVEYTLPDMFYIQLLQFPSLLPPSLLVIALSYWLLCSGASLHVSDFRDREPGGEGRAQSRR